MTELHFVDSHLHQEAEVAAAIASEPRLIVQVITAIHLSRLDGVPCFVTELSCGHTILGVFGAVASVPCLDCMGADAVRVAVVNTPRSPLILPGGSR